MTASSLVWKTQEETYLEEISLQELLQKIFGCSKAANTDPVSKAANTNPTSYQSLSTMCWNFLKARTQDPTLTQKQESWTSEHVEVEFTDIQPSRRYQCLLVMVCIFQAT